MKEFDLDFERHTTYRVEAENEQEAIAKFRKMEEEEQEEHNIFSEEELTGIYKVRRCIAVETTCFPLKGDEK